MKKSPLQAARASYQPKLPAVLRDNVSVVEGTPTQSVADQDDIKALFPNTYGMPIIGFEKGEQKKYAPLNVGVILSGGQAPGGHNVISGLFDGLKKLNPESRLYGFLGGPSGLVDHKYIELTASIIDDYRNTGGFDIIGSGRTKLEETEQFDKGLEICKKLNINAIVIIGEGFGADDEVVHVTLFQCFGDVRVCAVVLGSIDEVDSVLICISDDFGTGFYGQSQLAGAYGQYVEAYAADFDAGVT